MEVVGIAGGGYSFVELATHIVQSFKTSHASYRQCANEHEAEYEKTHPAQLYASQKKDESPIHNRTKPHPSCASTELGTSAHGEPPSSLDNKFTEHLGSPSRAAPPWKTSGECTLSFEGGNHRKGSSRRRASSRQGKGRSSIGALRTSAMTACVRACVNH